MKNGPKVAPGTYSFELKVGDKVISQSAEIMADPRVTESGVSQKDMEAQVALSLEIIGLQSSAKKLSTEIDGKMKPLAAKLKKKASTKNQAKYDELGQVYYQLETPEGIYMRSQLIGQINYLLMMINRADQVPGKDAYERFDELKALFKIVAAEYNKFK